MPVLEWCLLAALGLSVAVGAWSLLIRSPRWRWQMWMTSLLMLGGSALLAAVHQAEMLIYIGLSAGGFVALTLWEGPPARRITTKW